MLGAKYGFAQSMNCAVQTMDPYFVRAINGVCVHVRLNFYILFYFIFFNQCMCMACINQLATCSYLALHLRPVVYPRTGPASEPGSPLVWSSHTRGCG